MLYMHGFLIILYKHFKDKTFESREDNIYITGSELLPRPCVLELKSWNKIENHEKMPIQALMQDLRSLKRQDNSLFNQSTLIHTNPNMENKFTSQTKTIV